MQDERSAGSPIRSFGRRRFVSASVKLGALAATSLVMPGCAATPATKFASNHPTVGTLRLGMAGGSATDSFDVRTYTDSVAIALGYQVMNGLIEIDANRQPVPELFESWDVKTGATDWSFKLRSGVTFHNGKTLQVEDVIYSINLHRGTSKSPMQGALRNVTDIRADGPDRIRIQLTDGDADFLCVLSDYHLLVVPDGFTDWTRPVGTGAFKFEMYEPGIRASTTRQPNYWKEGVGNVQAVELQVINDDNRRLEALRSNQVDVINRVPYAQAASIENSTTAKLVRGQGGYHVDYAMNVGVKPFDNPDLRLALKFAIDREAFLRDLLSGYGRLGNDHPITSSDPFHNTELTQHAYDPDKASFHLRKSGLSDVEIQLSASEAAYKGAIALSDSFMRSAQKAGLKIHVQDVSEHGFWDDTWMKAPFFTSYWGGRPAATQMLAVAYASDAAWNETNWRRSDFDDLLRSAKSEIDVAKRRAHIWEMQAMLHQEGGAIIPTFSDFLDAHHPRVQGHTPHALFDFCNGRIAEKVSLTS